MIINSKDSDFNIINQTLLFHFINTSENEINSRFIETELIGLGCGKNFAFSSHPHNFILNNAIVENLADNELPDLTSLLISNEGSIFNYGNILEKNELVKSKKNKPKEVRNKIKKNLKISKKLKGILKLSQKSFRPHGALEECSTASSQSTHHFEHDFIKRINSLSESSFCALEKNRKNSSLILDLKKIRRTLVAYFEECHKAYRAQETDGYKRTNLFKDTECLKEIDRLSEKKTSKKNDLKKTTKITAKIDAISKARTKRENEFSSIVTFEISSSVEIFKDFLRIIINLDKLNMRNSSIQERLKVCECTKLGFQKTTCPRPCFWASDVRNSIFFKCHNRVENKREYDKNFN
jgi:hypothetical protein